MKELQKHLDAFELYFQSKQAGSTTKASIMQVASKQKYNVTTVWRWKKNFNWDEREVVRASEVNKRVEKRINSSIVDNKVKYLSFYHKLLDDLKNDFDIRIWNVTDLKKTIDGALVLQDEPVERVESRIVIEKLIDKIEDLSDEEYVELLRDEKVWKSG